MSIIDIASLPLDGMADLMKDISQPVYRGEQIFVWLHKKNVNEFGAMNNLPLSLRSDLEKKYHIKKLRQTNKLVSKVDGTVKFAFALDDGDTIETVCIPSKHGEAVCVSTQAGCRMGCTFCASAVGGFSRNLTAGEICAQVYAASVKPRSVVLMGCGEPLDNFDAVMDFIRIITHSKGKDISNRHITLSTCGLIPQIQELAGYKFQLTLSVSLHAPEQRLRESFMPVAKKHPLKDLISTCRNYANSTKRRVSFEYCLIKGVNDHPAQAQELSKLLKGMLCHVNLICLNKSRGNYSPGTKRDSEKFMEVLLAANIPVTIRRSMGSDINAACGQLRNQVKGVHPTKAGTSLKNTFRHAKRGAATPSPECSGDSVPAERGVKG